MKQRYTYFLLVSLLYSGFAFSQSFSTKISAKTIGRKDVLQVEYVAENVDLQDLELPVFNGWSILSGPNFSSSRMQSGNIVKQQIIYTITLQPQATGKLTIPGAKATIDGKVKLSNTASVEVKETDHVQGSAPSIYPAPIPPLLDELAVQDDDVNEEQVLKKGQAAKDKIKNNLLVKLEVNKNTAFVGESILVTYKLCTRIRSQSRVIKQPSFTGCTVIEMTNGDDPLPQKEKINGKWFNVYIIRQVQLMPLQPGTMDLGQVSVENKITFYREGQVDYRDLFYNNPAIKPEEVTVTFSNVPMQVQVKSLPQPAPEGFGGAVGNFSILMGSAAESDDRNAGNELQLTIIGKGNLQQIKSPLVVWPKGMEGFEPTTKDEVDKTVFPAAVKKVFLFPYVASKSGKYTVPPVRFTYFNTAQMKYISVDTKPLVLNVAKNNKTILPALPGNFSDAFYTRLYVILGFGLAAILIGLILYNRRQKPAIVKAEQPASKQSPTIIEPAVDADQFVYQVRALEPSTDGPVFYRQLHNSLTAWLLARYNIAVAEIENLAANQPGKATALLKLRTVIECCSVGMYTPLYNIEEAIQHRLAALEAINMLEKTGSTI